MLQLQSVGMSGSTLKSFLFASISGVQRAYTLSRTYRPFLQATSQRLLKAAKEVKLPNADRQLFWSSKESVGIHVPPAKMYSYIQDI